ncbi:uncharacterized protein LOC126836874 [Adelges cooleyi]|uniref:uncharacterized protein LOC126836874 n=1 Tax=Adelges cooleyi TaxID=133065 RepID=UPI00217FE307|nr:uncharacterized protein LOC126836874 [Adelges cooleyi]
MPSKKRKYNSRFPAGRIKKIMRIDDDIGKVALPVPVMISRAVELFVSSLLTKAGNITTQRNAKTLTLTHLKQCIYADSRLEFLRELVKNIPDISEENNDGNTVEQFVIKRKPFENNEDDSDEKRRRCKEYEKHRNKELVVGDDISIVTSRCLAMGGGCLCPVTADPTLWVQPRNRNSEDALLALSSMRLLLSTYRRQRNGSLVCPAVEETCRRLFEDNGRSSTIEYLVNASTDRDAFVAYVARCVLSDVYVAYSCRSWRIQLTDKLCVSFAKTTVGQSALASTVDFCKRILDDKGVSGPAPKSGFCERAVVPFQNGDTVDEAKIELLTALHGRWPNAVDAVEVQMRDDGKAPVFVEFAKLWTSILTAVESTEAVPADHYGSCLFRLRRVLYGSVGKAPHPGAWTNLVRLSSACLSCGRTAATAVPTVEAIVANVRPLLYRLTKTRNRLRDDERRGHRALQETVLLVLKCLRVVSASDRSVDEPLELLDSYIKSTGEVDIAVPFCRWVVSLFRDHDDLMVESALCALETVQARSDPKPAAHLNPFTSFAEFMSCVSFQSDVLLDFLISDENTLLLRYMLKILKAICNDPDGFFEACTGNALDNIMSTLIRLRLKILSLDDKHIFPYKITPIINLIELCDNLYSARI